MFERGGSFINRAIKSRPKKNLFERGREMVNRLVE